MLRQIPDAVLDLRVTGVQIVPGRLGDPLRAGTEHPALRRAAAPPAP